MVRVTYRCMYPETHCYTYASDNNDEDDVVVTSGDIMRVVYDCMHPRMNDEGNRRNVVQYASENDEGDVPENDEG